MSETLLHVSEAILLVGPASRLRVERDPVLDAAGVRWGTFRTAAGSLGALQGKPGRAFFDATETSCLSFGPGAGLAIGVSVGAESIRAVLVDANGWEYYGHESDLLPEQLTVEPAKLMKRIRRAVFEVLNAALDGDEIALVEGALPVLGCAVAWPTPIDRARKPVGHALAHNSWRSGQALDHRLDVVLGIDGFRSYALNDAHAAAIAVAHRETHQPRSLNWKHPMLTIVLRLAGNINGAVIVLEPPRKVDAAGRQRSGFITSILVGGFDNMAGEIGHSPVPLSCVEALNVEMPAGLAALAPQRCTCRGDESCLHLEAFASVLALSKRLSPSLNRRELLLMAQKRSDDIAMNRALSDIGYLVGDTLVGPVTVLNPAKIIVTGSLALSPVCDQIKARIEGAHSFGTLPSVQSLPTRNEDDFVRAKGAALALIRNEVHRKLDTLMSGSKADIASKVGALTVPLSKKSLSKT